MAPRPTLSHAQQLMAKALHAKGFTCTHIAKRMGVGPNIIYRLCDQRYRIRMDAKVAKQNLQYKSLGNGANVHRKDIPQHLIDERDRRSELQRTVSLTATLCGDPLPGYSALDRKAP